jgi:hypothetical protein
MATDSRERHETTRRVGKCYLEPAQSRILTPQSISEHFGCQRWLRIQLNQRPHWQRLLRRAQLIPPCQICYLYQLTGRSLLRSLRHERSVIKRELMVNALERSKKAWRRAHFVRLRLAQKEAFVALAPQIALDRKLRPPHLVLRHLERCSAPLLDCVLLQGQAQIRTRQHRSGVRSSAGCHGRNAWSHPRGCSNTRRLANLQRSSPRLGQLSEGAVLAGGSGI